MATIFPGSASVGQIFDGYEFNGTAWDIIGIDLTADYPEIVGGKISASVIPDTFATVSYVDQEVGNLDLSPYLTQSSASSTYITQASASTTYATKTELNNIDLSSASAAAVAAIVDSAPSTLNTLNELAAALGDDANYASTIATSLGNKLDISTASSTYLTQVSASTNYLTKSSASTTYQTKVANIDDTEIGYLNNASANIQTQLNSKLSSSTAANTYASLSGAKFTGNISTPKNLTIYGNTNLTNGGGIDLNPLITNLGTASTATETTRGSSTLSVGISQIFTIEAQASPAEITFISGSAGLSNTDLEFLQTFKVSQTASYTSDGGYYPNTVELNTYVNNLQTIDTSPNAVNTFYLNNSIAPNGGNYIFQPGDTITANGAPVYAFVTDIPYSNSAVQLFLDNYSGNVYMRRFLEGNITQEDQFSYDYSSPGSSEIKFEQDNSTNNLKIFIPISDFGFNQYNPPTSLAGYEFYTLQGQSAPIRFINVDNSDLFLYVSPNDGANLYTSKFGVESMVATTSTNQVFTNKTIESCTLFSPTFTGTIGPLTLTQSSNSASYPLTISSANQQGGGAGFSDILKIVNSKSGATNINKYFRMNSSGTLEIINSAYTASIFSVSDGGTVTSSNLGDTGWSNVGSFSNSFVSGGNTPGYRRLNNVVYLRGNINSGTAGQTAFTLPSGYRPFTDFVIPVQRFGTPDITYITVYTDGRVIPNTTSGWLTGVTFPVG